jgi:hypothetical protein
VSAIGAAFLYQSLGFAFSPLIVEDHARAGLRKHPHRRRPNPARSPGDQRYTVKRECWFFHMQESTTGAEDL